MSWIDRIENDIEIETGDGVIYTPSLIIGGFVQEYNVASFTFPNVSGTFVKRREPLGRKFSIEIIFQGENHLDIADAFRRSANVKKYWRVRHPFYDEVKVQPLSLRFDNSENNISRITGLLLETITGLFPNTEASPLDEINNKKIALDELVAVQYEELTLNIQPIEITPITENIDQLEESTSKLMEVQEDFNELKNRVNTARRAVTDIVDNAAAAMRSIQAAINYPFLVISDVKNSIANLTEQFNRVVTSFDNLLGLSKNEKIYIESMGANTLSASCTASISQLDTNPYLSRSEVENIFNNILEAYDFYIETLDSLQTESQTEVDSYAPNADTLRGVQDIVYLTASKLLDIALDGQIENVYINEADNNPISLTHRFYGLDENDENLQRFIDTNNIGLDELLNIRKGRELIYYS